MVDIDSVFRFRTLDSDKLLGYGFIYSEGEYVKSISIMKNQFVCRVAVTDTGDIGFKVYETKTKEEYVLVHVAGAVGKFVSEVRNACEKVLLDISDRCFNTQLFQAEQTKRIAEFIKRAYHTDPEFLWEKYPNYAAFRVKENQKWFAVIMKVDKSKIGMSGQGSVEIINLKDTPETVEKCVDQKMFYRAYHMNKKHWYTICLDGRVSDREIETLVRSSYELSAANKK